MSHPFIKPGAKGLRERVAALVTDGLHRTAATNILFVCGGDKGNHLRPKFIEYMGDNMPSYRPFRPEAAQEDFFEHDQAEPLNLNVFEELVSELSIGIILFAESPGSYAEAGLFSALELARKKTLVVLDAELQGEASFLSFGPAATIAMHSRFGQPIQLDYNKPNFKLIKDRIESRVKISNSFRSISETRFSDLTSIELLSLIWFYVDLLKAVSIDDLKFCFDSVFDAHTSLYKIKQILSFMVGAGLLEREGPLGLVRVANNSATMASPITSKVKSLDSIRIEMLDLIEGEGDPSYTMVAFNAY